MRRTLQGFALSLALVLGILAGTTTHVSTQAPFLVFGSQNGVGVAIKATSNALWVSLQGLAATSTFCWTGRSCLSSPADGVVQMTNNAGTGASRFIIGTNDATVNGASWVNTGGVLEAKTGDATAYVGVRVMSIGAAAAPSGNGNIQAASNYLLNTIFAVNAAPTISSGFGTSPSVAGANGTLGFTVNVGTGGVATSGVLAFAAATNGWVVHCDDITTQSATVLMTKQIAASTTTATIANFTTAGVQGAWVASDILHCTATGR